MADLRKPRADRFNGRSAEAAAYRRLYGLKAWKVRRDAQLNRQSLCEFCLQAGRETAATVADHVTPHRGDRSLFMDGKLQSLCDEDPWRCHSSRKQRIELKGFDAGCNEAGRPRDPGHPWNRKS